MAKGGLDAKFTMTSVRDLARAVVAAVEYEGVWPVVGGVRGTTTTTREVVGVVERLRGLVEEGRGEEAAREWEVPRRLLVRWRERGVGGEEVGALIEEGDGIVGGGESGSGSGSGTESEE